MNPVAKAKKIQMAHRDLKTMRKIVLAVDGSTVSYNLAHQSKVPVLVGGDRKNPHS